MNRFIKALLDRVPYVSNLRQQVDEQGAFPAGHYYSPIPSKRDVEYGLKERMTPTSLDDIDFCKEEQAALIEQFAHFYGDLPFPEKQDAAKARYYYDQLYFCYSDAIMLYCMIRKLGFKRIVEVGSGYSSAVMLDTLEALGRKDCILTFIEPYPERLRSLVDIHEISNLTLHEARVQTLGVELFQSLDSGDLLFIDSSHVVKYGSDLQFLLFKVLPVLKTGVYVHFHDIFYPFEYPAEWLIEGRYWNECYFLRAFLSGNHNWKIVLFNNYINQVMGELIQRTMPLCQKNFGGSIYLQKTR